MTTKKQKQDLKKFCDELQWGQKSELEYVGHAVWCEEQLATSTVTWPGGMVVSLSASRQLLGEGHSAKPVTLDTVKMLLKTGALRRMK